MPSSGVLKLPSQEIPAPADFPDESLDTLRRALALRFEEMVARHGERPAVTGAGRILTYRELNRAANRIARALLDRAQTAGTPVAVMLGHDPMSVIAMLGVLKAGAPYVGLQPSMPAERLRATLDDTEAVSLITAREFSALVDPLLAADEHLQPLYIEDLDLSQPAEDPGVYPSPEAPFGIFYTSGTTGRPKGVVHDHRTAISHMLRHATSLRISPSDRFSQFANFAHGVAYFTVYGALLNGATVCVFDHQRHGPEKTLEWIDAQRITLMHLTPSVFRALFGKAAPGKRYPSLRLLSLAGEAMLPVDLELFRAHTAPHCWLRTILSGSDTPPVASMLLDHDSVLPGDVVPSGYPVPDSDIWLEDQNGQPVADGEPGEIVVRSPFVIRYWKQPELTSEKFQPDPDQPGLWICRTGDMARRRPDGMLEFLGRKDLMVKLRGQRVELGEIEAALLRHPGVKEAVVAVKASRVSPDGRQLVGYAVQRPGRTVSASALRDHLAAHLPAHMIPASFVFLEHLPVGSTGKLDRNALPDVPEREALATQDAPANDLETRLVEIWRAGLKTERVGVHDNYFELGGDSLSVLSMMLDVEKLVSKRLPAAFFRNPTIRGLADLIRDADGATEATWSGFNLQAFRSSEAGPRTRPPRGLRQMSARLRRQIRQLRRSWDRAYPYEFLLARSLRRPSFESAVQKVERLASRSWLLGVFYGPRRRQFQNYVRSLGADSTGPSERFRKNVIANLVMKIEQGREPFDDVAAANPTRARREFARTATLEDLDLHFPVSGMDHLEAARASGRGVILASVHGSALHLSALEALSRRLGVERIQTIAQRMPLQQSEFWGSGMADRLPGAVGSALRAELAFHAQSLLRRGEVIHVSPDVIAFEGPTHAVRIGDRIYAMSGGIAELALNTGAPVIPAFGRFTERTRLLVELLPPLEAGAGSREQQIRNLLDGYGAFATDVCRRYPEAISWKKMRNHLKWPRAAK